MEGLASSRKALETAMSLLKMKNNCQCAEGFALSHTISIHFNVGLWMVLVARYGFSYMFWLLSEYIQSTTILQTTNEQLCH